MRIVFLIQYCKKPGKFTQRDFTWFFCCLIEKYQLSARGYFDAALNLKSKDKRNHASGFAYRCRTCVCGESELLQRKSTPQFKMQRFLSSKVLPSSTILSFYGLQLVFIILTSQNRCARPFKILFYQQNKLGITFYIDS